MKKCSFALILLILCACGSSDKKPAIENAGSSLQERLNKFMEVNDSMDIEKIMDLTYPRLFTIVPRTQLIETTREFFDNSDVKVEMDSLRIDKIYPVFNIGKGNYAKVQYSMIMHMHFKNSEDPSVPISEEESNEIHERLAQQYGEENVRINETTRIITIRTSTPMVAVKDEYAGEWSFVNLKDDNPMMDKLFTKEVQEKLKTYK